MAEFNTFDLGRVLQTAEALKSIRRQEGDDLLRRQYLQQQIAGNQQAMDIQRQQFQSEQGMREAKRNYLELTAILRSNDPHATARMYAPELVQKFEEAQGPGAFDQVAPEALKQFLASHQDMAAARAGIQRKIRYEDAGGKKIAIDDDTGMQLDVAGIEKTPEPVSQLELDKFDETKRHNRATEAAATKSNSAKPPSGYEFNPDGTLRPIKGGPGESGIANQLRDEYNKASGNFITIGDSYNTIKKLAANPSPAGDISLIFSYMKMNDPGSTVREGEYANAQNAGSIPTTLVAKYNKMLAGDTLAPSQRKDFEAQARNIYEAQRDRHDKTVRKRYEALARKNNVDPESVVSDFEEQASEGPTQIKSDADYAQLPSGAQYVAPDGSVRVKR